MTVALPCHCFPDVRHCKMLNMLYHQKACRKPGSYRPTSLLVVAIRQTVDTVLWVDKKSEYNTKKSQIERGQNINLSK